jgi:hypothetical protein
MLFFFFLISLSGTSLCSYKNISFLSLNFHRSSRARASQLIASFPPPLSFMRNWLKFHCSSFQVPETAIYFIEDGKKVPAAWCLHSKWKSDWFLILKWYIYKSALFTECNFRLLLLLGWILTKSILVGEKEQWMHASMNLEYLMSSINPWILSPNTW